jgi:NADH dehydrogenase
MRIPVDNPDKPPNQAASKRPRVVIVGAGFAGIHAAKSLGKLDLDVTIVDRRNHHTFQPLLYQVALAVLSPADIAQPIRTILRKQANTEVLMDEVTGSMWPHGR